MELGLPLALRLVQRVCGPGAPREWRRRRCRAGRREGASGAVQREQRMIRRRRAEVETIGRGGHGQDQNGKRVRGLVGKREKIQKWLAVISPLAGAV